MVSNNTRPFSSGCASVRTVTVDVAFSYLYFFLFPVALLLNGVAAWVSLHLPSTSTFIVYLKNLVVADLLMTLALPPMAASMLPGAAVALRAFDCRYSSVLFYCSMYTSITLLGLISLDRFFKIVRPCGMLLGQNVVVSLVISTLVWMVVFGSTFIPTVILTDKDPVNKTADFCMSLKGPAGVTLEKFVVLAMECLFWLVTLVIVFCYICITLKVLQSFRNSGSNNRHGKQRTKLRVFLILLVFFVCFVPLHVMRVPLTLYETADTVVCVKMWVKIMYKLVLWLSATNACLDPLVSIYLCREFRDKLVDMMKARGICVGLHSGQKEGV
ncbi:P2Y purinoceptor 13-like [Etheostoma cragini]|uniref:P2Y purinoceptor 13-like n=1 Tax=Etheostoma cragini TaxID=417921 RepID=UPI00155EF376|nr:P2Y purinoceptor 13-like [Etheostoma cragini]